MKKQREYRAKIGSYRIATDVDYSMGSIVNNTINVYGAKLVAEAAAGYSVKHMIF